MMLPLVASVYIGSALIYILYLIKIKKEGPTPVLFWVIFQTIMFSGIVMQANNTVLADRILVLLHFIGLYAFIIGNILHRIMHSTRIITANIAIHTNYSSLYQMKCAIVVLLSFIACIYMYSKATNIINILFTGVLSGKGIVSIERARYVFTQISGNGYIYQFRAILLPLMNIFFLLSLNKKYEFVGYCLCPFTAYFLLGTGQRGAAVVMFIVFLVNIFVLKKMLNYKIPKLLYFLIIVGGIAFCILTIANGRSQTSGSLLLAIIDRIFKDNQYTAIIGFRYIFEQPTQWCYDWGMQIANLLPNQNSYLALDYVINNIIYGGYGGTCPPSFIGSVYYNLGGGITPFFLLGLGYLYQHITYLFYKRATNPLDVTCYAFLVVKLGSWVAGDISNLLNSGVLVVLCLQIYMNFLARKRRNKYVCRIRSINKVDITMH